MGHNSVVSSYPKSIGIPRVDGLSTGPLGFRASHKLSLGLYFTTFYFKYFHYMVYSMSYTQGA